MFIGHAALGFAAKALTPKTPLAALLIATYWLDIVWPVLLLAGIERVRIDPGNTAFTPLDFVHYPWTHSLAAALGWSALFGLACLRLGKRAAVVLGLVVLSHWALDFLSHRADLPLVPGGGVLVGLGLWNSVAATILVECGMFAAGVWIYARTAPARGRTGRYAFWGLVLLLLALYFANAFGPPPPSPTAIALAGLAGALLFAAWASWIDRHRGR